MGLFWPILILSFYNIWVLHSPIYTPVTNLNYRATPCHLQLSLKLVKLSFLRASMAILVVVFGVVLGLCFCSALLRWNEVRYSKKGLPPGTMGWPVFGETTEFLKQGPIFMKTQRAR